MAREIPGFFYDEEKGKYFRIQQSHRTVPGTGYTRQTVKEVRQAKEEQQRVHRQIQRRQLGSIVRSSTLLHNRSSLAMRLGATTAQRAHVDVVKQYAAGLSRCHVDGVGPLHQKDRGFLGSSFSITHSGVLRANYRTSALSEHDVSLIGIRPDSKSDETIDLPFTGLSTHWVYNPRFVDLLASVYTTSGEESVVVSCDSATRCSFGPVSVDGRLNDTAWLELDITRMHGEMVWDIAAAPNAPIVAVATDTGLMIGDCHDLWALSIKSSDRLSGKEQMNVCFKDANIIMSGERSGRINFTDARNGLSVVRLLHSSAVLGTLPLPQRDLNQILAHGYSTTSIYDLRWVKQTPVSRKARSGNTAERSKTYLDFAVPRDRWTEQYTRGRKVAYSADLDLVAAASSSTRTDGIHSFVTLYSARTGRVVDSPLTRHMYKDVVRSVDIRRVRDGPESIFCLSDKCLDEWGYGRMSRAEYASYGIELTPDGSSKHMLRPQASSRSIEQEWNYGNRGLTLP